MNEVAIMGVAMHPWGKFPQKSVFEMAVQTTQEALKDAGLGWKDVQLLVAGEDPWSGQLGLLAGSKLASDLGWSGIPVTNVYNACATGAYCMKTAQQYILAGSCDVALVMASSKSPEGFFGVKQINEEDPADLDTQRFRILGMTNPARWALEATRRVHKYGTTDKDLAMVKVKNSTYGAANPLARYKKVFTLEEVLNSPIVSSPLRLYEICATSDGAAAVVMCSMKMARKLTNKPVILASVGVASPLYPDPDVRWFGTDFWKGPEPTDEHRKAIRAARKAYEEAGIGPEDLTFAELYDLYAARELQWYEDIGLCPNGDAEKLLRDGATKLGGKIPVCVSGGLSSFGEAIPAQAIAQACELTWQLRGQAGPRQVANAKIGFAINEGMQGNCSAFIAKI